MAESGFLEVLLSVLIWIIISVRELCVPIVMDGCHWRCIMRTGREQQKQIFKIDDGNDELCPGARFDGGINRHQDFVFMDQLEVQGHRWSDLLADSTGPQDISGPTTRNNLPGTGQMTQELWFTVFSRWVPLRRQDNLLTRNVRLDVCLWRGSFLTHSRRWGKPGQSAGELFMPCTWSDASSITVVLAPFLLMWVPLIRCPPSIRETS